MIGVYSALFRSFPLNNALQKSGILPIFDLASIWRIILRCGEYYHKQEGEMFHRLCTTTLRFVRGRKNNG